MAHVEHYTRADMTKVTKEAYREHKNPAAYKNNVDLSKSHLNYTMRGFDREKFLAELDARCVAVMQGRKMQTQTNVISSVVHTCPEELRGDPEKEKAYFKACYDFCRERYGDENVIDAIVHYDEGSPHMTVLTCPVCTSRKTGKTTISSASLFTRRELQQYHPALDKHLESVFGVKGLALNGRTKGGYSLAELKQRTKDEQAMKAREDAVKVGEAKNKADAAKNKQDADDNETTRTLHRTKNKMLADKAKALDARESEIKVREDAFAKDKDKWYADAQNALTEQIRRLQSMYDDEYDDVPSNVRSLPLARRAKYRHDFKRKEAYLYADEARSSTYAGYKLMRDADGKPIYEPQRTVGDAIADAKASAERRRREISSMRDFDVPNYDNKSKGLGE